MLDRVREVVWRLHYSIRTGAAYLQWIKRLILFHGKRRPLELGEREFEDSLSHRAVERNVVASTENLPSWVRHAADDRFATCLEHEKASESLSVFSPKTIEAHDRVFSPLKAAGPGSSGQACHRGFFGPSQTSHASM